MYQRITMNMGGAKPRRERLDGRDYLVVPSVILTEGVHAGNQGPLLYPAAENGRNPLVWNHKPILVNHPGLNAESGCQPDVLEVQGVGLMLNSSHDGRLKTEAWLNEAKLGLLAPGVLDKINAGETVEVSTGLHHDPEWTAGEWNGEKYIGIARNHQPDHLAILTTEKGACSVADGAGLLRNAAGEPVADGPSYDNIREQLRSLLKEQLKAEPDDYAYVYIQDVFPKVAVFEWRGDIYSIGYKVKAGLVSLDGEPEKARQVTSYVTANAQVLFHLPPGVRHGTMTTDPQDARLTDQGKETGSMATPPMLKNTILPGGNGLADPAQVPAAPPANLPGRTDLVNQLISGHGWSEADRQFLTDLPDNAFQRVAHFSAAKAAQAAPAPVTVRDTPAAVVPATVLAVSNAAPRQQTTEEFIANAPPAIRQVLLNSIAASEAHKKQYIDIIFNCGRNKFTREWLAHKYDEQELYAMALLAQDQTPQTQQPVHNYAGQGEVPMFLTNSQPAQGRTPQGGLPIPVMDWSK